MSKHDRAQNTTQVEDYWKVLCGKYLLHKKTLTVDADFLHPPFISICGPGPETSLQLQLPQRLSGFPSQNLTENVLAVNSTNFLQTQSNDVFLASIL